jgi:hypothetical protein
LPAWIVLIGSAVIGFHFFAVGIQVLAAPMAPWLARPLPNTPREPEFARGISQVTTRHYLMPLRMTHNYHFATNYTEIPGVTLRVRLLDEQGGLIKTVEIPDKNANAWVRHRQLLLVQNLVPDLPVELRGEAIAPRDGQPRMMDYWEITGGPELALESRAEHLVPRNRPVMRPPRWAVVLAKSYARHLCREHNAVSAEVIRHSREAIPPSLLLSNQDLPGEFPEVICTFGKLPR